MKRKNCSSASPTQATSQKNKYNGRGQTQWSDKLIGLFRPQQTKDETTTQLCCCILQVNDVTINQPLDNKDKNQGKEQACIRSPPPAFGTRKEPGKEEEEKLSLDDIAASNHMEHLGCKFPKAFVSFTKKLTTQASWPMGCSSDMCHEDGSKHK
jgi:hypothetical protein